MQKLALEPPSEIGLLAGPEVPVDADVYWLHTSVGGWVLWLCAVLLCGAILSYAWLRYTDRGQKNKKRKKRRKSKGSQEGAKGEGGDESCEDSPFLSPKTPPMSAVNTPCSTIDGKENVLRSAESPDTATAPSSIIRSLSEQRFSVGPGEEERPRAQSADEGLLAQGVIASGALQEGVQEIINSGDEDKKQQLWQLIASDRGVLGDHQDGLPTAHHSGSSSPNSIKPRSSVRSSRTNSPIGHPSLSGSPLSSPQLNGLMSPAVGSIMRPSRYCEEYEELTLLGKGAFGCVHRVRNRVDENEYAVKKVSIPQDKIDQVLDEVRIISRLDHPNVIRFYTSWIEDAELQRLDLDDFDLQSSDEGSTASPLSVSRQASSTWCWSGVGYKRETAAEQDTLLKLPELQISREPSCTQGGIIFTDEPSSSVSGMQKTRSPLERDRGQWMPRNEMGSEMGSEMSRSFCLEDSSQDDESLRAEEQRRHSQETNRAEETVKVLYISMQLCQTETLYDWLKGRNAASPDGRVDRKECLSKLRQMVAGIEYVHSQNLIHRCSVLCAS